VVTTVSREGGRRRHSGHFLLHSVSAVTACCHGTAKEGPRRTDMQFDLRPPEAVPAVIPPPATGSTHAPRGVADDHFVFYCLFLPVRRFHHQRRTARQRQTGGWCVSAAQSGCVCVLQNKRVCVLDTGVPTSSECGTRTRSRCRGKRSQSSPGAQSPLFQSVVSRLNTSPECPPVLTRSSNTDQ
jgi:hypothetical protein